MRQIVLGIIALFVCSGAAIAQDAAQGEKIFLRCKVCHQIGEGAKNLIGPELNGVVGRPSASIDGFNYSDGMKNAHLTWTEENLSAYVKNPKEKVPGNKMAFPGLPQPQDVANVIAYLKQFGADGKKTP